MLGFDVLGWSRTPKKDAIASCFHGAGGFDDVLAQSDIIVVLLPLTSETRGIISAPLLAKMQPGSVLINAGRGGLQVERDILAALESGHLGAASLDVFEREPLPTESPLWSHKRVFITPHNAATSDPSSLVPVMIRQMEQHERGEPLTNVVNRESGY